MRLKDKRFLITGAAQGIGLAICERFLAEGASIALIDRNGAQLEKAAAGLGGGGKVFHFAADVSDEKGISETVTQACDAMVGCDGVVNCAGVDLLKPFEETSRAEWDRTFAVNLTGPFLVCQAALPALKRQGGAIVNIASAAGLRPLIHRTGYCATKAGLVMFTKALSIDLSAYNIRANVLCPGITDTPQFRSEFENEPDPQAELASIMSMYQIKRIASPHEVAAAALFLASDESSYITGAAIAADGGRSFH